MKVIISGSLGNTAKPLAQQLIAAKHDVTVISSQEDKKTAIEAMGAKAAIGSISDTAFLQQVFTGADAVFAMTPPNMGGGNVIANTVAAGKAFAAAIAAAGVRRVVMLSSIGADVPAGTGPIQSVHVIEQLYQALEGVAVTFLRAGYFYLNFYNNVPLIKGMGIIGGNFPATLKLALVHPTDIAAAAAEELQRPGSGKNVRYVISGVYTPGEVAKAIGEAIGKPELPWVEFTNEQSVQGMTQAGVPQEIAELYTELGVGLRTGKIQADFEKNGSPVTGATKLEDFAREFAQNF